MHRYVFPFMVHVLSITVGVLGGAFAESVPAGEPLARNSGITMDYYRNFFSGSMNHLKQMHKDGETPFRTIALPDFQARSPWNMDSTRNLGRLYGVVIHGWLSPDVSGEYVLSAQCNGTMELHLSPDANAANARPIVLEKRKQSNEGEKIPGQSGYESNRIAPESIALNAGEDYFVKVYFLPGWQDSLSVGWNLKDRPGTRRVISGENLKRTID